MKIGQDYWQKAVPPQNTSLCLQEKTNLLHWKRMQTITWWPLNTYCSICLRDDGSQWQTSLLWTSRTSRSWWICYKRSLTHDNSVRHICKYIRFLVTSWDLVFYSCVLTLSHSTSHFTSRNGKFQRGLLDICIFLLVTISLHTKHISELTPNNDLTKL